MPASAAPRPPAKRSADQSAGDAQNLVAVGRIGPPRGIRGEAFVEPWTDDPDERFAVGAVLLADPAERGPLTVAAASSASGKLVVRFEGVDDRAGAEAVRGTVLLVDASSRPPLGDPDDFYDTDLVGLVAVLDDGSDVGPVIDVMHSPASDFLVVERDGKELLVPFVRSIVPTVDVAAGRVVITPPEGLLEL